MFSINIQLTKSGKENVDKVIEAVFAFLGMLRRCKPEERIFNEAKQIKSLGFEYGAEPQPSDNVENLAGKSFFTSREAAWSCRTVGRKKTGGTFAFSDVVVSVFGDF